MRLAFAPVKAAATIQVLSMVVVEVVKAAAATAATNSAVDLL